MNITFLCDESHGYTVDFRKPGNTESLSNNMPETYLESMIGLESCTDDDHLLKSRMKVIYLSSFAGSNMSSKSFIEMGPQNVTF